MEMKKWYTATETELHTPQYTFICDIQYFCDIHKELDVFQAAHSKKLTVTNSSKQLSSDCHASKV